MTPARGGRRQRQSQRQGTGGAVGARPALERFHSEIEFHMTPIFYDIVSISYGIGFTQLKNGKFLPFILRSLPFVLSCEYCEYLRPDLGTHWVCAGATVKTNAKTVQNKIASDSVKCQAFEAEASVAVGITVAVSIAVAAGDTDTQGERVTDTRYIIAWLTCCCCCCVSMTAQREAERAAKPVRDRE